MTEVLATLDPHKLALPIIALIGLVPVILQYRNESRLFVAGYVLLVVATVATNVENIFLGTVLNYSEHYLGLMGSGIAFMAAAYVRRQRVLSDEETTDASPEAVTDGGTDT